MPETIFNDKKTSLLLPVIILGLIITPLTRCSNAIDILFNNEIINNKNLEQRVVKTLAGPAENGSLYPGDINDFSTDARFSYPWGITADNNNIYICDYQANSYQR